MKIKSYTYKSNREGPNILIFGAIHGNEVCGPTAMESVIHALEKGTMKLLRGSVTFVPVCNPSAYKKSVRYIDSDLNRIFTPSRSRKNEALCANVLCKLVDTADVLLDVHSISAKGKPFIYVDYPTQTNSAWAASLSFDHAILGWPSLYKNTVASDTTQYAHRRGVEGLLVECGQHNAKRSVVAAKRAILGTLIHFGLIAGAQNQRVLKKITMKSMYIRKEGERLAKKWRHLDPIQKGAPLVLKDGKTVTKALSDGYVIMPKYKAAIGEDWLYFGIE